MPHVRRRRRARRGAGRRVRGPQGDPGPHPPGVRGSRGWPTPARAATPRRPGRSRAAPSSGRWSSAPGVCEHLPARRRPLPDGPGRGHVTRRSLELHRRQARRDGDQVELPNSQTIENRRHPPVLAQVVGSLRPGAGAVALLGRPAVLLVVLPAGDAEAHGRRVAADRRPGVRRPRRRRGSAGSRRTRSTCPCCRDRVRLDDATDAAPADPAARQRNVRVPADHLLPAACRAAPRRRRPRAGADRRTAGRHPAGAAELVDAVPRRRVGDRGALARAGPGQAARAHRPADPAVRAGRGVPAAAGGRAARARCRLPGGPRRPRRGCSPRAPRWSSPGRCCSPCSVAVAGGLVTAALSSRQVFRRPVSELLRRVPPRRAGREAGLVEGVVLVLAVAGVVQLVSDRGGRPSPVALLAPGHGRGGRRPAGRPGARPGGAAAYRACRWTAAGPPARSAGPASRGGRAPRGSPRCSPSPPACSSSACRRGRWPSATGTSGRRAETGAEVVLQVRATEPPGAARRRPGRRPRRAATRWPRCRWHQQPGGAAARRRLRAAPTGSSSGAAPGGAAARPGGARCCGRPWPAPVRLGPGRLAVERRPAGGRAPVAAAAHRPVDEGGTVERVVLGELRAAAHTYAVDLPDGCAAGDCRLAALAVDHPGTDIESATADLVLESLALAPPGGGRDRAAGRRLRAPGAWRPGAPTIGGPEVQLPPGDGGLRGRAARARRAVRRDRPRRLARAVAGVRRRRGGTPRPTEGGVPVDETTGLDRHADPLPRRSRAADYVPRVGRGRRPRRPRPGAAPGRGRRPRRPRGLAVPRRPGRRGRAARGR